MPTQRQEPRFVPPEDEPTFVVERVEREAGPPVDPLYERQASLGLEKPSAMIVGCGGVGCWVALALVLGGVDDLTLYDGDTISTHNFNRFPLPEAATGQLKSEVLAKWLSALRPKADITARGSFDPKVNPPSDSYKGEVNWVICATDSLASRRMCQDFAGAIGARYLEVGADGENWTLSPSSPEFSTELEGVAGYQSVPVHVGPCMMAGAAAAYYVLHDIKPVHSHSGGWKVGPILQDRRIGAIRMESMPEEDFSKIRMVTCPRCGVQVQDSLITIVSHLRRAHDVELQAALEIGRGLRPTVVEPQPETEDGIPEEDFESPEPVLTDEDITQPTDDEWTPEQVADEWAETEEGQAILNAADPVAEATTRVEENDEQER